MPERTRNWWLGRRLRSMAGCDVGGLAWISVSPAEGIIDALASGRTATGTDKWKAIGAYGLHQYRSVAWIKNAAYWQDEPGRKNMAVNYELVEDERLTIERIAIIADELWPVGRFWPDGLVHYWLREQHARGITVRFVRESILKNEPELIADIGIYGTRAVGVQELNDECRTVRFTLTFDFDQVQAAEECWQRLSVYAESLESSAIRYESAS